MADGTTPPDPGGYLETSNIGLPAHWVNYSDYHKDIYGPAAIDKYNQYASDPIPGGSDGKDPLSRKDKKG